MSCNICGRNNCTTVFHSIEEQEEYDKKYGEIQYKIDELREKNQEIEKTNDLYWSIMTNEQRLEAEQEETR